MLSRKITFVTGRIISDDLETFDDERDYVVWFRMGEAERIYRCDIATDIIDYNGRATILQNSNYSTNRKEKQLVENGV